MLAIRSGKLIDGSGGEPIQDAVLLVDGERITAVGPAAEVAIPADAELLDYPENTVIPGLIDAHVHVDHTGDADTGRFTASQGTRALRALKYVNDDLDMGWTTLRSLGTSNYVDVALRDAINEGIVEGPRLVVSGEGLSTTGGHMDGGGLAPEVTVNGRTGICDGPWECRRAARAQIKRGADVIKISVSIGSSDADPDAPYFQDMTYEEMAAIVEQSHAYNRRVAGHSCGGAGDTDAIRAGIDSLEHAHWLSDEQLAAMAEQGTFYVPTMIVNERCAPAALKDNAGGRAKKAAWLQKAFVERWDTLKRAKAAGVKIAAGTDAGCLVYHGEGAWELELLVRGGFTPMEAILAATQVAADCLDKSDDIGTLSPGKYADLVVVDGDPLADITILKERDNIRHVFKGGKKMR